MASLRKAPHSPFWIACVGRTQWSTKVRQTARFRPSQQRRRSFSPVDRGESPRLRLKLLGRR
jgi:hypothetical protein